MASTTILSRSGQFGGMELRLLDEANWLSAAGYRASVRFTPFDDVQAALERARSRNVPASVLDFPLFMEEWTGRHTGLIRGWIRALRLRRWLASDLVHVPFAWTDQGLTMLWLGARVAPRVVISVHNTFPPKELTSWHRRHLASAFAKVVGVYGVSRVATDAFKDIFGDLLPKDAIVRSIPNFVDGERFRPSNERRLAVRSALGIPEQALVIASVGRLSEQKRPDMMLDLFARVVAETGDVRLRLVYVGAGELQEHIQERAWELGIADRVVITGFVGAPEDYLAAADLHVLTSVREGFGIVTVEAMACGIPAVATDVPASREILAGKEGGLLIPRDDVASGAGIVRRLVLNDEERLRRGALARTEALAEFGRAAWSDRLQTFYDDAMR